MHNFLKNFLDTIVFLPNLFFKLHEPTKTNYTKPTLTPPKKPKEDLHKLIYIYIYIYLLGLEITYLIRRLSLILLLHDMSIYYIL